MNLVRNYPETFFDRLKIVAIALLAGAGLCGESAALDRYEANVTASGTVGDETSVWYFEGVGAWKEQRAGGDLLPFKILFHNNDPARNFRGRISLSVSTATGRPEHWDDITVAPNSAMFTAYAPPGTSVFPQDGDQFHRFEPRLRFLERLPPGNFSENSPLFHDFRHGGDGGAIPMRERLVYTVFLQASTGIGGDPVYYDSVEIVLYVTGKVGLAAGDDATAEFSFTGRLPVIHVYSRADLLVGTRPGAIDGEVDDIKRACACDESCIAGAMSVENNSVDLRIGMGTEEFDIPRSLRLKSDLPVAALAQPVGLEIDPSLTQTFDASGENLLQIVGESSVVAVQTIGEQEYELDFHHKAAAGAPDPATGLYSPGGEPHTTIHLPEPGRELRLRPPRVDTDDRGRIRVVRLQLHRGDRSLGTRELRVCAKRGDRTVGGS